MAEEEDDSSKTEDPTQKKLMDARQQGNLPISRDLATWFLLLGSLATVALALPFVSKSMLNPLTVIIARAGETEITGDTAGNVLGTIFGAFIGPVLGIGALLMLLAITGWIIQTGFMFSMELLKLRWDRLNPVEGFKRLFSAHAMVELIKSIVKFVIIGYVGYALLKPLYQKSEGLTGMDHIGLVSTTYSAASDVLFAVFLVYTALVIFDVAYQRFTYFKNLRMSKTELKEEFRQTEGDPHVKGKLRRIRQEKARRRMMAAVPKSDVVITNPTHYAVALKYDQGAMQAPVVLAKGHDAIALKIRAVAEENKIPIVSNPPLARALYATVEIDEEIPPEHYRAVAEVISYVYKLKNLKTGEGKAAR